MKIAQYIKKFHKIRNKKAMEVVEFFAHDYLIVEGYFMEEENVVTIETFYSGENGSKEFIFNIDVRESDNAAREDLDEGFNEYNYELYKFLQDSQEEREHYELFCKKHGFSAYGS